jgi:predicted ribosomally synthesized peptide with nif11-like leader
MESMSKETVKEFFNAVANDEVLQDRLKAVNTSTSIVQIASEKGYEFTTAELQGVMQEAVASENLSLEELEAVAGGDKPKAELSIGIKITF